MSTLREVEGGQPDVYLSGVLGRGDEEERHVERERERTTERERGGERERSGTESQD